GYLRAFWSLGVPGWTNWAESMTSSQRLFPIIPKDNLVRIGREYVRGNLLEADFSFEAQLAPADRQPPLADFLRQAHKTNLYQTDEPQPQTQSRGGGGGSGGGGSGGGTE